MFVLLSFNVFYTLITVLLELEIELKHINYSIILLSNLIYQRLKPQGTQDVRHLFNCTTNPTTLTPESLCDPSIRYEK